MDGQLKMGFLRSGDSRKLYSLDGSSYSLVVSKLSLGLCFSETLYSKVNADGDFVSMTLSGLSEK